MRYLSAACIDAGERTAGVWVVAGDPGEQEPLTELGPKADTLDRATLGALRRRGAVGCSLPGAQELACGQ